MSAAACGAYIRLLCAAWSEAPPGSVPNDDRVLARLTGMAPDDWQDVRPEVIVAFEEGRDGRLYQKRLRQEYEKVACKFKAQRQNGQKGGRPKNPRETQQKPMGSHARSGSGSESGSSKGDGGSGGKGREPPEDTPLPSTLDTEAFRRSWRDWCRHRREIRAPLKPTTVSRQLPKLERFGHDGAIASIERSIENGWRGLFEPRREATGGASAPAEAGTTTGGARPDEYPEESRPLPRL